MLFDKDFNNRQSVAQMLAVIFKQTHSNKLARLNKRDVESFDEELADIHWHYYTSGSYLLIEGAKYDTVSEDDLFVHRVSHAIHIAKQLAINYYYTGSALCKN